MHEFFLSEQISHLILLPTMVEASAALEHSHRYLYSQSSQRGRGFAPPQICPRKSTHKINMEVNESVEFGQHKMLLQICYMELT